MDINSGCVRRVTLEPGRTLPGVNGKNKNWEELEEELGHPKMIRADLHYHGPIGLQPYWLKKQGYRGRQGYEDPNLLKLIVDAAIGEDAEGDRKRDIGILAITSQEDEIPKGSIHDRLNYLVEKYAYDLKRTRGYSAERIGESTLVVDKNTHDGEKRVCLVSGQTVYVKENGIKFCHVVVGSNQVPNFKSWKDTLNYGKDHGLIQIAENPFVFEHFGIEEEKFGQYLEQCDAIEGHDAQLVLPRWCAGLDGFLGKYTKVSNDLAKKFANTYEKPWIAVSNGHRIEDAGVSYIAIPAGKVRMDGEEHLLEDLKTAIRSRNFFSHEEYSKFRDWADWTLKFYKGITLDKNRVNASD